MSPIGPVLRILVAAGLVASCAPGSAAEREWPQFLGPHRDGKVSYAVSHDWPSEGPEVLWRREVGEGFASPSVAGGRLILFHRIGDEEIVEALDPASGETLWRTTSPTDFRDTLFGFEEGPRAAPTIVDGVVYTSGAERWFQALDMATGERIWGFDATERYRTRRSAFGNATQPFWVDGRLTLNVGGREAGIVAVDAATGETVWTSTDHEAGYAQPLLMEAGGLRRLLYFTREGLVDLDPDDGSVRSFLPWRSRSPSSVNAAAPLQIGERVFVSASYGTGAALLELDPNFEFVWSGDDILSNHYVTSIHHDGTLYGIHGRQPLNPSLRAVDPERGRVLWVERQFGTASLLLAGDTLILMGEDGELVLAEATPEAFRPLARAQVLDGVVRAYPALADGVLHVRNQRELIALDLRVR